MINLKKITLTVMGICVNFSLINPALSQTKLTLPEINSIAKQTTVIIVPQLTQQYLNDLFENKNKPSHVDQGSTWGLGSGVLIAKQGNTYYVLTVAHNFLYDRIKENHPYGIVTGDRTVHVINNINDGKGGPDNWNELITKKSNSPLLRFGCYLGKDGLKGIDLAIISFKSDKNYTIAPLGKVEEISQDETIYISGWPKLEEEPKLNQDGSLILDRENRVVCQGMTPRRNRRLAWGPLKEIIPFSENQNGYSLLYLDYTRQGMSGGPVFDSYGRVIGVHGKGSQEKPKCGEFYQGILSNQEVRGGELLESHLIETFEGDSLGQNEKENNNWNDNYLGQWSQGQNIDSSRQLLEKANLHLEFNTNPPSEELIKQGIIVINPKTIQGSENRSGRADFGDKEGAMDDPSDVVDNIYKLFSFDVKTMLRDKPSGGCGSLLLGDGCY